MGDELDERTEHSHQTFESVRQCFERSPHHATEARRGLLDQAKERLEYLQHRREHVLIHDPGESPDRRKEVRAPCLEELGQVRLPGAAHLYQSLRRGTHRERELVKSRLCILEELADGVLTLSGVDHLCPV